MLQNFICRFKIFFPSNVKPRQRSVSVTYSIANLIWCNLWWENGLGAWSHTYHIAPKPPSLKWLCWWCCIFHEAMRFRCQRHVLPLVEAGSLPTILKTCFIFSCPQRNPAITTTLCNPPQNMAPAITDLPESCRLGRCCIGNNDIKLVSSSYHPGKLGHGGSSMVWLACITN